MPEGAGWRRLALDPPRALGAPPATGRLKDSPEDFVVEEQLGFAADGGRGQLLLLVEKRAANTQFVARGLARLAGCRERDVGYAGLKDRQAVARQWFTVPLPRSPAPIDGQQGDGWRVLSAAPHSRKLRRGALAGNRFRIVVRGLAGDVAALGERLPRLAERGAPNYFGPQRFGRDGANLDAVADWLAGGPLPARRDARGFLLSAARALAFNAVLGARVLQDSWDRLLPGEVVNLDGSQSLFQAEAIDDGLAARCAAGDLHPTGPLCGDAGKAPGGEAAAVEAEALAGLGALPQALAAAGLEGARRALRVRPSGLDWNLDGDRLEVSFGLPRGAYATALLRELLGGELPDAGGD